MVRAQKDGNYPVSTVFSGAMLVSGRVTLKKDACLYRLYEETSSPPAHNFFVMWAPLAFYQMKIWHPVGRVGIYAVFLWVGDLLE